MYTVKMQSECGCFKRSEFESEKSFDKQQDAYNYSNLAAEIMNEDFCTKHLFVPHRISENEFVIGVSANPNAGSCGTTASSCSTGSCGCE